MPEIKDSGARREFESGAVRDIQEGKGRCDLLPLDVVACIIGPKDGREFIVEIENAINLDNLSLEFKDKDDIIDKVAFEASYDPEAEDEYNECWKIKYKTASV